MKLSKREEEKVLMYLEGAGLSFQPLLNEMFDHIITDIEGRMEEGASFDRAFTSVITEIPQNHFMHVQQETMETIKKRFTLSRVFTFLFLGLIILASLFKFLHLPGAGQLMIGSFLMVAVSLLISSISGVFLNITRKGTLWVLTLIIGVLVLLGGFSFKIFHLPGAGMLVVIAVLLLLISSIVISINIFRSTAKDRNLLTYLHEKYTPGIERSLLILLAGALFFKVSGLIKGAGFFVGDISLIIVIYGAGMQLLALYWRTFEHNPERRGNWMLFILIAAICFFLIPIIRPLFSENVLLISALLFYISAGALIYLLQSSDSNQLLSGIVLTIYPVHFALWSLTEIAVLPQSFNEILYSIPVTMFWLILLLLFRKDRMMFTYMILAFAAYMLQYPPQ